MTNQINLSQATFDKQNKELRLDAKLVGGYPREILVMSDYTQNVITFRVIGPEDRRFDMDQWDGELQIYAPVEHCPRVEYMIVSWHYD